MQKLPNYVNDKTAWEKAREEAVKRGKGNRASRPRLARTGAAAAAGTP
jgi:hypothetical protein